MQKEFQVSQYKLVFTFSLINYLKEVLVLDGVSVRWYMQTKFSRYYIFPYNVVYLLSFRFSPLNVCTSFLTNNFVSHNPAFKWRNAFSFFAAYLWVTNKFDDKWNISKYESNWKRKNTYCSNVLSHVNFPVFVLYSTRELIIWSL